MGYDMRYRKADPDEAAAVEFAQMVFTAACNERDALPDGEKGRFNAERAKALGDWDAHEAYDGRSERYRDAQDKVHAAYGSLRDAEKSYFRLNISGMSRYMDLMQKIGMAFEDPTFDSCQFPRPEEYGTDSEHGWALGAPEDYPDVTFTDEQALAATRYRGAVDKHLAWHGAEQPGIPLHKFSSNDGWLVLPAEADAAVRIWQQFVADQGEEAAANMVTNAVGDDGMDYWLKWISYLAGTVRHDGFEVH